MNKIQKNLALLFLSLNCSQVFSQLSVANTPAATNGSPSWLVNNILAGSGVNISNVSFTGDSAVQIGYFNSILSNVGINEGIIMTTGDISLAPGGPGNSSNAAGDALGVTIFDQDLSDLNGATDINDIAILEFDFIPIGDSIGFKYVFASEEYNEYVGSNFNDVFGFFLSGPGINGAFTNNAVNMAVIPGTNIPVAINNVNNGYAPQGATPPSGPCTNCAYYNSNTTNPPANSMEYDGFTNVLVAYHTGLQCGQTYHIKIAIADINDGWYDSGVFLERGSFSAPGSIDVQVFTTGGTDTIVEGCTNADFLFIRHDTSGFDTINYTIGGSAINGTDYTAINGTQLLFNPGDDTLIVSIHPLLDGLTEGIDSLSVNITTITPCGDTLIDSTKIYILDPYQLGVSASGTVICQGDTTRIVSNITGGVGPFTYIWSNGSTNDSLIFTPDTSGNYMITVQDHYGCSETNTVHIHVHPQPNIVAFGGDTVCPGDTLLFTASGGINYNWYPSTYISDPTNDTTFLYAYTAGNYVVVGSSIHGCYGRDTLPVLFKPIPALAVMPDPNVCKGDDVLLQASGTGTFLWGPEEGLDNPNISNPTALNVQEDRTYMVSLANGGFSCRNVKQIHIKVFKATATDLDTSICRRGTVVPLSSGAVDGIAPITYDWQPANLFNNNTISNPEVTIQDATNLTLIIKDGKGCTDTVNFYVGLLPVPNLSFEKEVNVNCDSAVVLYKNTSKNADSYTWSINDNFVSSGKDLLQTISYDQSYALKLEGSNTFGCKSTLVIDDTVSAFLSYYQLLVPNVFSPNNDLLNEKFGIPSSSQLINCTEMVIFDRWGKKTFESSNTIPYWDGKNTKGELAAEGTYFYIITFKKKQYTGTVQLIR